MSCVLLGCVLIWGVSYYGMCPDVGHVLVAVENPLAVSCVLVRRLPTPTLHVTFNQPTKVSMYVCEYVRM